MQCTSILGNPQHTLGVMYRRPQMWHHWHSRAPWVLRIAVPMSLNTHITQKPSTHTGRYVSPSPSVASLVLPSSMCVTYCRFHESQCNSMTIKLTMNMHNSFSWHGNAIYMMYTWYDNMILLQV